MGQVTNGIDKIEIADIGTNNWRTLGYTNIDSTSVTDAEGTTTDFNVEELDVPIFSRFIPGKTTLGFQIADPSIAIFQEVFGGTITGVGDAAVYKAPLAYVQKEFTVRITPKVGYYIQFNRLLFKPRKDGNIGKNNLFMITVSADMLNPTDGVTEPLTIGGTVGTAGGTGSRSAQTITFAPLGSKSLATNNPLTLTGSSSSGLPLTYQSTDFSKATVSGNVVTLIAAGSVSIIATQLGNAAYAPAPPVVNALTITA